MRERRTIKEQRKLTFAWMLHLDLLGTNLYFWFFYHSWTSTTNSNIEANIAGDLTTSHFSCHKSFTFAINHFHKLMKKVKAMTFPE